MNPTGEALREEVLAAIHDGVEATWPEERFNDFAMSRALRLVNTPLSRSSAWLSRVTLADHFCPPRRCDAFLRAALAMGRQTPSVFRRITYFAQRRQPLQNPANKLSGASTGKRREFP